MRCDEAMRRDVTTCSAGDSVRTAAAVMRDKNMGFLPVRDADGKVMGVITDRDIAIRACAAGLDPEKTLVEKIMTQEIHFCSTSDKVSEAEDLMARRKIQRVMIMDEKGDLAGVISLSDLGKSEWGWRIARTMKAVAEREATPAG